jgi:hypothetical protein
VSAVGPGPAIIRQLDAGDTASMRQAGAIAIEELAGESNR